MNIPYSTIRPDYWKIYNYSKINCVKEIYQLVSWATGQTGDPWKKSSRGRPYEIQPTEYASLIITMFYSGWSYRELEGYSSLLISRKVDSSNIGWAIINKLSLAYMNKVNNLICNQISKMLGVGYFSIYITDSTGIATDRYFITRIKLKLRRKLQELKLHIIARYYPEAGRLVVVCIGTSKARAHDSPQFRRMFDPDIVNNGMMFGDASYGCEENRKLLVKNNIIPVLKYRGDEYERMPYSDLYQEIRSIIETVW